MRVGPNYVRGIPREEGGSKTATLSSLLHSPVRSHDDPCEVLPFRYQVTSWRLITGSGDLEDMAADSGQTTGFGVAVRTPLSCILRSQ